MNKLMALVSIFIVIIVFNSVLPADERIVVTHSGLKYQDLKIGAEATAEVGNIVVIHIIGWLDDNGQKGMEFIDSHDRGMPVSFKLGTEKVMQGWNLGVAGMKVGGKRRLMIPSELGYGAKKAAEVVPPNADLICEVELLEVK
ncbi:MAG: FKBP-type peptidyl-prolyl cis-trans isomerase [Desulfobacterales bacterium]